MFHNTMNIMIFFIKVLFVFVMLMLGAFISMLLVDILKYFNAIAREMYQIFVYLHLQTSSHYHNG